VKVRRTANTATLIIPNHGKPAGAIAGRDFLRKPIMHCTLPSNCRTGRTYRPLPILLACLSALTLLSSFSIDAVAQVATADTRYERVAPSPDGIGKRYMGREISGVMGWEGAQWLERESRAHEERPALLLRELALAPGMTVADIGAGTGYYTWQLAKKVGPNGRVYAVDVQPQMIAMLDSQMAKRGVRNVVSVLGSETTVKLPPASVDLAIMVDVYHELAYPAEVLDSIVEYRAEDPAVAIKPLHKMSEAQIRREATAHGLKWERSIKSMPIQHAVVFRKP
jgi:2-polyprenyl-3-methyl-5-hydroxy-6-metoxy-1,4-benzoquinol methylase